MNAAPNAEYVRPVERSMFPELLADRAVGRLVGSVQHGTNADLIATVAPLYLRGSVLDVTYGRGGWWRRYQPDPFAWHDLAVDGVDFRALPEDADSWDAVCFDPPYTPAGGAATTRGGGDFRDRYGLVGYRSQVELDTLIADGLAECGRIARRWVLVKCADYVNAQRFTLGHVTVLRAAAELGLACHDLIVHAAGSGPGGGNIVRPLRARRTHSYLIVLAARSGAVA